MVGRQSACYLCRIEPHWAEKERAGSHDPVLLLFYRVGGEGLVRLGRTELRVG